jgi:electron transport complex protein RnfG
MADKVNVALAEKEPSSFRLISALAMAGLISGIVLVATFVYTNPLILANKEAALQRAIFRVLPDCASYETLHLEAGKLVVKISTPGSEEKEKEDAVIYAGYNEDRELVGFAVPGSEPGFQDIISVIFGYDGNSEKIIGFEVLDSKETPGLGDKIFKDTEFQTNFKALSVKPEMLIVKKGKKNNPNEVQAITGATISSKAVVKLLNNTISQWDEPIAMYLEENNLKALGAND